MRPSNRSRILDAALNVVEQDGVNAVTFESVAQAAGLTRGGITYHFPSREDLLLGLHQYLAAEWEAAMVKHAGVPAEQATEKQRLVAYLKSCEQTASSADLQLYLESNSDPRYVVPWNEVAARWLSSPDTTQATLTATIVKLAANGLWLHDSLSPAPLPADIRRAAVERLIEMLNQTL